MRTPTDCTKRFWDHVDVRGEDECWLWTGAVNYKGYGRISFGGRGNGEVSAHRTSLEIKLGRPIQDGMLACHKCNNPLCVNPNHLYEGTYSDNFNDAVLAGAIHPIKKGTRPKNTRLTEEDVIEIRMRLENGEKSSEICIDYPVGESQIRNIGRRYRWSDV